MWQAAQVYGLFLKSLKTSDWVRGTYKIIDTTNKHWLDPATGI